MFGSIGEADHVRAPTSEVLQPTQGLHRDTENLGYVVGGEESLHFRSCARRELSRQFRGIDTDEIGELRRRNSHASAEAKIR